MDMWSNGMDVLLLWNLVIYQGAKYLESQFYDWNVVIQLAAYLLSFTCAIFTVGLDFSHVNLYMPRIARMSLLFLTHSFMDLWSAFIPLYIYYIDTWIWKMPPELQDRLNGCYIVVAVCLLLRKYWKMRHFEKPRLSQSDYFRLTAAGFGLMMTFFVMCFINTTYEHFTCEKLPTYWSMVLSSLAVATLMIFPDPIGGVMPPDESRFVIFPLFASIAYVLMIYNNILYQEVIDLLDGLLSSCGLIDGLCQHFYFPLLAAISVCFVQVAGTWLIYTVERLRIWTTYLSRMAPAG